MDKNYINYLKLNNVDELESETERGKQWEQQYLDILYSETYEYKNDTYGYSHMENWTECQFIDQMSKIYDSVCIRSHGADYYLMDCKNPCRLMDDVIADWYYECFDEIYDDVNDLDVCDVCFAFDDIVVKNDIIYIPVDVYFD